MSGSCRESLWMSRSGQDILSDVREWSGGHPGCLGVVGNHSRMSGSGREILLDVREWSGGSSGCLGMVERPSWLSGMVSRPHPDIREGHPSTPVHPGGPSDHTRTSGRTSRSPWTSRRAF